MANILQGFGLLSSEYDFEQKCLRFFAPKDFQKDEQVCY